MWEKDKMLLKQYRDCMASFIEEMREANGEDIDYPEACYTESTKLALYIGGSIEIYKERNPVTLSENKQNFYNPKLPFFQDL